MADEEYRKLTWPLPSTAHSHAIAYPTESHPPHRLLRPMGGTLRYDTIAFVYFGRFRKKGCQIKPTVGLDRAGDADHRILLPLPRSHPAHRGHDRRVERRLRPRPGMLDTPLNTGQHQHRHLVQMLDQMGS